MVRSSRQLSSAQRPFQEARFLVWVGAGCRRLAVIGAGSRKPVGRLGARGHWQLRERFAPLAPPHTLEVRCAVPAHQTRSGMHEHYLGVVGGAQSRHSGTGDAEVDE